MSEPAVAVAQSLGLLERDRQVAAVSEALARARAGSGALVMLRGPAGIGKSRLLAAGCDEAERQGMELVRARGVELDQEVSFGVVSELFGARLESAAKLERAQLLAGHASLAAPMFDPAASTSADPHALVRGLFWLTVNLAAQTNSHQHRRTRGLAIAVDDAQWSDRPSLKFLAHLAARIDALPVTVLLAVRTGEPAAAEDLLQPCREAPGCDLLDLAPLSDAAVGALVNSELPGAEIPFVAACAEVSGGNPFMLQQLVRALREAGVEPTVEGADRVRRLVPGTVLHSVLTRLGRLGEVAHKIAVAVAVLGDGTPLRLAIALSGCQSAAAENAADALAAAGILAPEEPLRFTHSLIATAVYADLPTFARARAHRQAAELLAADGAPVQEIAAHLRLTRPDSDPWTVRILRKAATRDIAQGDPDAAAGLLTRALAEPPESAQRAEVLLELAEAEALRGNFAAEGHVERALEELSDRSSRVPALRLMGRIGLASGNHGGAAAALEEILSGLGSGDACAEEVLAEYLTVSRFTAPLLPEVRRRLSPIVEAARNGDPPTNPVLLVHVTLELAMLGADIQTIRELAERATAGDPLVDLGSHAMPMGILVQALCCADDLSLAERIADAAVGVASRRGSFFAAATANHHRAIPRYHRGALADAMADLHQALAPHREGWSSGAVWSHALMLHVHLERGDLQGAVEMAEQLSGRPDSMDVPVARFARARLALVQRNPDAALADALAAGGLLRDPFGLDHPGLIPWRLTAASAAVMLGDHRRARQLADEQLELARALGAPRGLAISLRTFAVVSAEPARSRFLSDAADVLDHSQSALERAYVLVSLGGALRRAGRRSDAQAPLREALQLANRMGAVPLADAARDELRATGARPRRAAFTGADALTPGELRVAQLAARGLTNAQIAQDLFITTKTVQTHLAHTYRKLDITSRRDLQHALGREGP